MTGKRDSFLIAALIIGYLASFPLTAGVQDAPVPAEVDPLEFSKWVAAGEVSEIPWNVRLWPVRLRPDQRLEFPFSAHLPGKGLARIGAEYDLIFVARISNRDGEWLGNAGVLQQRIDQPLTKQHEVMFGLSALVVPGEYTLWVAVFDRQSGKRSVAKRDFRVSGIKNDPLAGADDGVPPIEFARLAETESGELVELRAPLTLQVETRRPVSLHFLVNMSPPEQWLRRMRLIRNHRENARGAVSVFSQLAVTNGSVRLTGLDLIQRGIVFEQESDEPGDWFRYVESMKKLDTPLISTGALEGRKSNGAFFRDVLAERLAEQESEDGAGQPMRVIVVVSSTLIFENGSDLKPLQTQSDCHCRIYHLRYRLSRNDLFDELGKFMKPLKPKTFDLFTPEDFRKALGAILKELREL